MIIVKTMKRIRAMQNHRLNRAKYRMCDVRTSRFYFPEKDKCRSSLPHFIWKFGMVNYRLVAVFVRKLLSYVLLAYNLAVLLIVYLTYGTISSVHCLIVL